MSLYTFARVLIKGYLKTFYKLKVYGVKNIPKEGPLILISNHISNFDPVVIACSVNRKVHFMAKKELFDIPILGSFLKKVGQFPINRGGSDRKAIKTALDLLKEQEVLGIFPEGTRSKDKELKPGLPGAALFALKSDVKVIPIGIDSSYKWFQPIIVNIGNPIQLDSFKKEKVSSEDLTETMTFMMAQIKKQLEEIK
ncbi:lysophospholipid acyltransferase family protein [Tepidibacillus infernus]|uniref:1-acyl-sn-glycerol-3-phosphate acyltransferase n=1 Tax=Tepidibacillus decaturensis TaxID=1413211 RepID=A0A135L480_9BACI|nr:MULTISPECIES: lysophospholipid acyltransferase family protein [Tepidibacillus]KXG43653.1 hypothetical protein U473_06200 [Tepidibacillus decaturensis]GBF11683.1 1-acyl-sn-glycerol-3-phosphate acyltransferase [Tepidibacillus sp. HK-1]